MDRDALQFSWAAFSSILSSEISAAGILLVIVCIILILIETFVINRIEDRYDEWEQSEQYKLSEALTREQVREILENSRFDEEVEP